MRALQRFTTIAYMCISPLVFILAPLIVRIVSGTDSRPAIIALRLLVIAVFLINANTFRVQFLLVSGRDSVFSRIHLVAGSIGIVLVFVGAYLWSYVGPAIALIIISGLVYVLTPVNQPAKPTGAQS